MAGGSNPSRPARKRQNAGEKMVEIRKHIMVPPHEIMSGDEVKKLLERYRITKKELPKILMSDPVIKEMNAKIGDVLKITRKSAIAGVSYYYRVVVEE